MRSPDGRRPGWAIAVVLGPVAVFGAGLALLALLNVYDLRHFDAVTARSASTYAVDDHGLGYAGALVQTQVSAAVTAGSLLALVVLVPLLLRGGWRSWALTGILSGSYTLCCGAWLPAYLLTGPHDGGTFQPAHDASTPPWTRLADPGALWLVVVGAALTTGVLLLPAVRRALGVGSGASGTMDG